MIEEIKDDTKVRMTKSLEALQTAFNKIRTGRAHPSLLENIMVDYYGSATPISQLANIGTDDARTLVVTPWEDKMVPEVEKAIMKSDLGLNPSSAGRVIRVPMPMLTEETRKGYYKQAKDEAEKARVSIRNARRDANSTFKDLIKDKEISEDEERKGQEDVQKITDAFIADVEKMLQIKEADLMEI
ncbi:MAG: ribosome recycling factor [Pseudomonadales bacterium]|nr:ribosome recycling factor [Pseudomonadales bacterium]